MQKDLTPEKKKFSFLFFYEDSPGYAENKTYIATTVEAACQKFADWRIKTSSQRQFDVLDCQVSCEGNFIYISNIPCVKEYLC